MADRQSPSTPLFVAAAALIDAQGRVLVQQRPAGTSLAGLWEFPGGKLEPGEAPAAALVRELAEELAIGVSPADLEPVGFADAPLPATNGSRRLILLLYLLRRWEGAPQPLAAAALAWHPPAALDGLAMPPADRPLVAALHRHLRPG